MGNPLSTVGRRQRRDDLPADPALTSPKPQRRWSRWWALWLILGYLGQVGFRLWLSRMQVVPLANPDESAYLVEARVLADAGAASDFSYGTLYQAGYPLLLVPIYWFTSNSVLVYHATMVVNAIVNSLLMPLAYLALRRLYVRRWMAFAAAAVAALVPEGVFYTQYALSDAVFPVVVLGWLLAVHTWLTAKSRPGCYAAAVLSALLAGYAYAVHPRGLVVVIGFGVVAVFAAIRRIVPAWTIAPAVLVAGAVLLGTSVLDNTVRSLLYPEGPRSLAGEAWSRLTSGKAQVQVLEMAGGQLWRVTLDTWGIAAIGLIAAAVVVFRRGVRRDLRIMAALTVLVTLAIVYIAPAALPAGQQATWASGRYPDAMEVTFFIVGVVVLLRARGWWLVGYAAVAAALAVGTAALVQSYAGPQNVTGFAAFNWADPTVLTQDWTRLHIWTATAVGLGLLALWVLLALVLRRLSGRSFARWRAALLIPIAAMNIFALVQMTTHISQAATPWQRANSLGLVTGSGLKPGDQVAVDENGFGADWESWIPQSFEVWWTQLQFFDASTSGPPAGTTVVEVAWPTGKPVQASWPQAPSGWHVVAENRQFSWVAWRAPASTGH